VTTPRAANWGRAIWRANGSFLSPTRSAASRLVRLDTGSSRLAVFASQTVVMARGSAVIRARRAVASRTGVSRTAVVSRLRKIVVAVAKSTQSGNRTQVRPRPSAVRRKASTSNSWASESSLASTTTEPRNTSRGKIRAMVARASCAGSSPVATAVHPSTNKAMAIQSRIASRRHSGVRATSAGAPETPSSACNSDACPLSVISLAKRNLDTNVEGVLYLG
jgi:hypothetical protein